MFMALDLNRGIREPVGRTGEIFGAKIRERGS